MDPAYCILIALAIYMCLISNQKYKNSGGNKDTIFDNIYYRILTMFFLLFSSIFQSRPNKNNSMDWFFTFLRQYTSSCHY